MCKLYKHTFNVILIILDIKMLKAYVSTTDGYLVLCSFKFKHLIKTYSYGLWVQNWTDIATDFLRPKKKMLNQFSYSNIPWNKHSNSWNLIQINLLFIYIHTMTSYQPIGMSLPQWHWQASLWWSHYDITLRNVSVHSSGCTEDW